MHSILHTIMYTFLAGAILLIIAAALPARTRQWLTRRRTPPWGMSPRTTHTSSINHNTMKNVANFWWRLAAYIYGILSPILVYATEVLFETYWAEKNGIWLGLLICVLPTVALAYKGAPQGFRTLKGAEQSYSILAIIIALVWYWIFISESHNGVLS